MYNRIRLVCVVPAHPLCSVIPPPLDVHVCERKRKRDEGEKYGVEREVLAFSDRNPRGIVKYRKIH